MKKNRLFWIVVIAGFMLDRLTKFWVVQTFKSGQTLPLLPGVFHLTYVNNSGAAFSLFLETVDWLRWYRLGVGLAIMAFAWFKLMRRKGLQLGLGCFAAGSLGNAADGFLSGGIVDFLDFRLNPTMGVINLADILINLGLVFILVAFFQSILSLLLQRQ